MAVASQSNRKNLSAEARTLIATARNDITIPRYSTVLSPLDDTLIERGQGKGLKLYDEVKRDARVRSSLQKRAQQLVAREWVVEAASETAADKAAAAGVEALLNSLPFDKLCLDLLDATLKGFAVVEIVWGRKGNEVRPVRTARSEGPFVDHDQRRFVFDEAWRPRLLTFEAMTDGIPLPERKFIIHRVGAKGNNPYGLGLGSTLFWHVLFKREGVAFWMRFLEKFATPVPVGKYPQGMLEADQQKILDSLVRMAQDSAIVIPIGTELGTLEAKRAGEAGYESWCRYWDEQTAEVVLGETLTTNIGSTGSKAAAETHSEILELLVDADGDLLSDTLNDSLIAWYCAYNHPMATPPRVWRPRPENELEQEELKTRRAKREAADQTVMKDALKTASAMEERDGLDYLKRFSQFADVPDRTLKAWMGSVGRMREAETGLQDGNELDGEGEDEPGPAGRKADRLPTGQVALAEASEHGERSAVSDLVDQLGEALTTPIDAWLAEIKDALAAATDGADASRRLLGLTLDETQAANRIADALVLAELVGRADVLDEGDTSFEAADETGIAYGGMPFDEAVGFLRQKVNLPTKGWRDLARAGHDRAFVVAGAEKAELVEDLHQAMLDVLEEGDSLEMFRKRFDAIAAEHGWTYKGGRNWRTRIIYETNLRTAYQAGRLKQMRDPDVVALRPWWQYRHAETRVPKRPRPRHVALDGKVYAHNDPIWDRIYPPNGWLCSCGVRTLSRRDMDRLGKTGADEAPLDSKIDAIVPPEWRYQPGDTWERGLVPSELQRPLDRQRELPVDPLPALQTFAKPMTAERLADDLAADDYVERFLAEFGGAIGKGVLFRDKAGYRLPISDQLFRDRAGAFKAMKRGRHVDILRIAETIKDPDEIWMDWVWKDGRWVLDRRYLRFHPMSGAFAAFDWTMEGWYQTTGVTPRRGRSPKTDATALEKRRRGVLIYRRPEGK